MVGRGVKIISLSCWKIHQFWNKWLSQSWSHRAKSYIHTHTHISIGWWSNSVSGTKGKTRDQKWHVFLIIIFQLAWMNDWSDWKAVKADGNPSCLKHHGSLQPSITRRCQLPFSVKSVQSEEVKSCNFRKSWEDSFQVLRKVWLPQNGFFSGCSQGEI